MIKLGGYKVQGCDINQFMQLLGWRNVCSFIDLSLQPVDMIGHQGSIESDAEPLPGKEEEDVEENMEDVLRQHQRVETGALVYRILVVSFQLIKSNDLQRKLL